MSDVSAVPIALVGNPNTGKSTLFARLSGVRVQTGNYPGVTVERKIGRATWSGREFDLIDLPGTYSLAPRSPDEMVSVDVLLGRRDDTPKPRAILCIVDASNLERNLFLTSQLLELELPLVVALNMSDVAKTRGHAIDADALSKRLGVPVIPVQANVGEGLEELKQALAAAVDAPAPPSPRPFPEAFEQEVADLQKRAPSAPRFLVERALLDVGGWLSQGDAPGLSRELIDALPAARERLKAKKCPIPAIEAIARYGWAGKTLKDVLAKPEKRVVTWSDRVDKVLTHRVWGALVFAAMMFAMFLGVLYVAEPFKALAEWGVEWLGKAVAAVVPEGALRSLLVDGVIGGVGGVVPFLPQIFVLFAFIAVLEDCGYMARAAYLMDRLMAGAGLSGKSFIPLLSSFACAIPGIMGTRVIENRRDRLATMLVAPLMSCSARVPVYVLMASAFIPNAFGRAAAMFGMYALGIVTAVIVALVLKRTLLKGATPPFVMELPTYKFPSASVVFWRMLDAGGSFLYRAGTLILAAAILVWAATYFPHDESIVPTTVRERLAELEQLPEDAAPALLAERSDLQREFDGAMLANSYLGRAGRAIEPAVKPLGWDWRIGCAAIASFPAREVVVGTMGVIFRSGDDENRLAERLKDATWEDGKTPLFTTASALSVMVFFSLCAQCVSTLATIRREADSWGWAVFTFVYMTALAYVAALATFQIARAIGW